MPQRCAQPGCDQPGVAGPYTGSDEYCPQHWAIADTSTAADERYQRLRDAVDDYNRALRAYGLLGTAWIDHSDELDRLWAAVLEAAGLEPMPERRP